MRESSLDLYLKAGIRLVEDSKEDMKELCNQIHRPKLTKEQVANSFVHKDELQEMTINMLQLIEYEWNNALEDDNAKTQTLLNTYYDENRILDLMFHTFDKVYSGLTRYKV